MVCIYCGSETKVINSRRQKRTNNVWRRRECLNCSSVFTTIESPELSLSILVQRKTAVEAFSKETLLLSVYEACRHRKTATNAATALTSTILGKLLPQIHQATLTREQIIGATSKVLKNFDKAAYTAYLAYHPV